MVGGLYGTKAKETHLQVGILAWVIKHPDWQEIEFKVGRPKKNDQNKSFSLREAAKGAGVGQSSFLYALDVVQEHR